MHVYDWTVCLVADPERSNHPGTGVDRDCAQSAAEYVRGSVLRVERAV